MKWQERKRLGGKLYLKSGKFMSRIGKKTIQIPSGVEIALSGDILSVKGPKGSLTRKIDQNLSLDIKGNEISVSQKKVSMDTALWGTFASHIKNMISGVTSPFVKKLIIEGIGYKSDVKGKNLVLSLGFSHPVNVSIPDTLSLTAEKNIITITGIDKEEVGSFSAKIRSLKKPEPYKGKGIRYEKEVVKRKQGKKSA